MKFQYNQRGGIRKNLKLKGGQSPPCGLVTKLIILKLGGSVITKKSEEKAEINQRNLNRLAKEIAQAKKQRKFRLVVQDHLVMFPQKNTGWIVA